MSSKRKNQSKTKSATLRFIYIHLINWKNFTDVSFYLPRRLFVVGPNASGKSNLLDAFRFLRDITSEGEGLQMAVRKRGGLKAIRALSARRRSDVEISVRVGKASAENEDDFIWEYSLSFKQDSQKRIIIQKERIKKKDPETGEIKLILNRPDEHDKADPERLRQTYLEQTTMNKKFRELAHFFSSVKYLHIIPQIIREPNRYIEIEKENDPYGSDFLKRIARTNKNTRNAWLRRITEALKIAVPNLEVIELYTDETGIPHLRGKYKHWRAKGAWQTEEQFSDGTLRLLGLLWSILEGKGPLLLEEPELSLHPGVVRYIPQMFAQVQKRTGRQIIVSTHSFDMLKDEGIGPGEVILLLPEKEGTRVEIMKDLKEARVLLESGLNVGEVAETITMPENVDKLSDFGK